MGFGLQLHVHLEVRLCDCKEMLTAAYLESDMSYVWLTDLLHLSNIMVVI